MNNHLESLSSELFQPLLGSESALILGGGSLTMIGYTSHGGSLVPDHEWDEPPSV